MRQFLCPQVVGRDTELATLRAGIEGVRRGCGEMILVAGGAGLGKSRLVAGVAEDALRAGLIVLQGRATMATQPQPFRPLAEALAAGVRGTGLPDADELTPYRPFLGRLVPEWRVTEPLEGSIVLLAEAMVRLLGRLGAGRGCVLVLEDLHWADPETIAVVEYLADQVTSEPILCVVTYRPDETQAATGALRSLVVRRAAKPVLLAPLDAGGVRTMASACLDGASVPEDALEVLVTAAEGVPFFVEELLAGWHAAGVLTSAESGWTVRGGVVPVASATFADAVARRVAVLGGDAAAVLRAAAVLGRTFDWPLLPAMTELSDERVLRTLRTCVDSQLLVTDEQQRTFRFRHMLTREAVLSELLPPERAVLAGRALAAIEDADLADRAALALELAEMADPERAARLLRDLGRDSLARGALATAESALVRARTLATARRLWADTSESLVEVLAAAGKLTRALEVADPFLASEFSTDPRTAAVHLVLARAAVGAERWDQAAEQVAHARGRGTAEHDTELDVVAAQIALGIDSPGQADALARHALASAEPAGRHDVECEALQVLGRCARLSDLELARDWFDRAVATATRRDLPIHRLRALHERATIDLLGAHDISGIEAARELAVGAGAPVLTAVLDIQRAGFLSGAVDPDPLEAVASGVAVTARRLGMAHLLSIAVLWEAVAHARRGDRRRMEELIAEGLEDPAPDAEALAHGWCRAMLAFVEDDRAAAVRHLDEGERAVRRQSAPNPWGFRGLRVLLRTVEGLDGDDGPIRASGAMVFWLNPACLELADAVAAGRSGDRTTAEALFRRGEQMLAPAPWLRQLCLRHVAESAIRDGWGEPVTWLRAAADFFDDHGYDRLRIGCRSVLRQAGEPVPRRGRGSSAVPPELRALGVTSREVDVLILVGERLGNVEIGRRLYLSPRTVEKHVASLVAKTGSVDRQALVVAARRLLRG